MASPQAAAADVPGAHKAAFGVDLAGMDVAVQPGDDFYRYANGTWLDQTTIPPDKAEVGAFVSLYYTARARVQMLLESAAAVPNSKIGAFYASYLDEAKVAAAGLSPLMPTIAKIYAAQSRVTLMTLMADLQREGVTGLFACLIFADSRKPSAYAVYFEQDGLGLPDRQFYLGTDKPASDGRDAYRAYIARLLTLAGEKYAARRAAAVFAAETQIARAQWDDVQRRDEIKTYNRLTVAELAVLAPDMDWASYLSALGVAGQAYFVVREPSAVRAMAHVWGSVPPAVLKDWLLIRLLDRNAAFLSKPFVDAQFAFHGTAMSGTSQPRPRPARAAALVTSEMEDGVGAAYVAAYFPPDAKAQVEAIVANVKAAFRVRLAGEQWMDPQTREKAIAKLDTFEVVLGYPDHWRDDAGLAISADDLLGNVRRAERYTYQTMLARLGTRADRREFGHSAAEPWAWATPTLNAIGFTAAFLQPPFLDPNADAAVNYGGIGTVIGHELSHHFDDQGRLHDADGRLADWWTAEDVRRFGAKAHNLVTQYDAYEPLPGLHINGALTLGENLADLAGLNISFQAYEQSLQGGAAPIIDGFTGPQRFFLGYAQSDRSKQRDADLRNQVLSDPHPPEAQRADEVRNIDAWYQAFDVVAGQRLYLAPDRRVKIW